MNNIREHKVELFHIAMGLDLCVKPTDFNMTLRNKLIQEEAFEVDEAFKELQIELIRGKKGSKEQWAHLLKELVDVQYVVSGAITSLSPIYDTFDRAFDLVHSSNMSKLDNNGKPVFNEYGKLVKGPNYREPDLRGLIKC